MLNPPLLRPIVVIDGKPVLYDWAQATCDLVEGTVPGGNTRTYRPTERRYTIVTRGNRAYTFLSVTKSRRKSGRYVWEFSTDA